MSNYDQAQMRFGSEPRHRRMSRYDAEPVEAQPESTQQAPAETTRAPRVYDGYRETEAAARASASENDVLLQQRSRAFEKQAQHTGVYTRMTQTGYHQTIRQSQRANDYAAPAQGDSDTPRNGQYEEYEPSARAAGAARQMGTAYPRGAGYRGDAANQASDTGAAGYRGAYDRPVGRTNQRPAPGTVTEPRRRPPEPEDDLTEKSDDSERFPLFAKVILIAVLVLVLLLAGLYFLLPEGNSGIIGTLNNVKSGIEGTVTRLTGLIRPTEEPAQVKTLTCVTPNGTVGDVCLFNMTTSQNVTGVALCDSDGGRITSNITKALTSDDNLRIWELSVIFDKPYTGDIFASIQQGSNVWVTSDKYVTVAYTSPQPTQAPIVIVQTLDVEDEPSDVVSPEDEGDNTPTGGPFVIPTAFVVATAAPEMSEPDDPDATADEWEDLPEDATADEWEDLPGDAPEKMAPVVTAEPTDTPEPTATPVPTPTPEPTPTPQPTPTPLPALTASAEHSGLTMTENVYIGAKTQKSYERETPLSAPNPDDYACWDAGVLTFRGDNFRRNAAFGTAEIADDKMSVVWKKELGSLRTAENGTVYGVGWTGQPAIVKWSKEIRGLMNLNESKKNVSALREVIFSAQDGKVYFLDLTDGEETREPINIGYPLKGSVSVSSRGYPLVSFGQGISKLKNQSGKIGYFLYNLLDQSQLMFLNGRQSDTQSQYSTNGAFDGTDLTLWNGDHMILAGENGLLYTIDLNVDFKVTNTLTVTPQTVYLKSKAKDARDTRVGIESSIAMYNQYVFMADSYGALRCVDTTTMKTVWAFDTGDNTDAAIALDFDDQGRLWLYTGNTNSYRLGKKKNVSIRRLNAMTGEVDWTWEVACKQDNSEQSGCKASPVVGANAIDDLVIFTVNMLNEGGSKIVALEKATGEVRWEFGMDANAISSPVAVYNNAGDAWLIQGDEDGTLHMLDARSGAELSTLKLDGKIEASPAVYKNMLVIGTCSKGGAYMYGIRIE